MLDCYQRFANELVDKRLLIPTAIRGVFGHSLTFESIVAAVDRTIRARALAGGSEECFFSPVIAREVLRVTGYFEKFPHLCGAIYSFDGSDREHARLIEAVEQDRDLSGFLTETDLALTPAACYPLYPTLRGKLPAEGRRFTLASYVFRREPSTDPARLQTFRMREDIRVGSAEQVCTWRQDWMDASLRLLSEWGLRASLVAATDPFFGRSGRFLGHKQKLQELKFELAVAIANPEKPTAVASFNYHQKHFTELFAIHAHDDSRAETACIGFGLERLALALLSQHGADPMKWPAEVRDRLELIH